MTLSGGWWGFCETRKWSSQYLSGRMGQVWCLEMRLAKESLSSYTTDTREKPMSRLTFTRHSDALIGAHLPASEEQPRRPCLRTTSRGLARQALRVAQNRASCPSPSLHAHCQRRHRPRDTRVHIQAKLLIAVTLMKSDTVIHHVGDEARPATRQAP